MGESALLAGLMKGPSRYRPVADQRARRAPRHHRARRDGRDPRHHRRSSATRPSPSRSGSIRMLANQHAQYFVDWVDEQVRQLVGAAADRGPGGGDHAGPAARRPRAEQAVQAGVADAPGARACKQAALVALDGEGRVRAYVGGVDYCESQFDRATEARRQAGSSFKPFVYLTAMEAGRTPDTPVVDEPITIGNWTPRNYTGKYLGPITLRDRRCSSRSTPSPRGWPTRSARSNVAATAHRLGITSPIQHRPVHGAGRRRGQPAGDGPGLRALLQRRRLRQRLRHRAHPHRRRPGALRPQRRRRPAPRGDRPAGALPT